MQPAAWILTFEYIKLVKRSSGNSSNLPLHSSGSHLCIIKRMWSVLTHCDSLNRAKAHVVAVSV